MAAVCTATPSAAWSLDRLTSKLQARGWGELDGPQNAGLQKVLTALTALLPWESAEGRLTRNQVADAAGMSTRWASHCLRRLEDMGLINWRRGWLDHGTPRAGWIRVVKTRLAEMVRAVRGYLDDRKARRQADTRVRLAKLKQRTIPPWKLRHPLSSRGELSSPLPTQGSTAQQRPDVRHPLTPSQAGGTSMTGCKTCGRSIDHCQRVNSKVPDRLRHDYEPGPPGRSTLVLPAHALRTPPKPQHRTWRDRVSEVTRPPHPTLEGIE